MNTRLLAAVAAIPCCCLLAPAHAALYQITAIGLLDAEHTGEAGYRSGSVNASTFNAAGQVIGSSSRHNGTATHMGYSAWLYNGATTVNIGLTGAEHTRIGVGYDYKYSYSQHLNAAGQAAGISERYSGIQSMGRSAWLYDGVSTLEIGLRDSGHTRSDGYRFSDVNALNAAGQVTGYAERYSGSIQMGRSAWLYNGTDTLNIGLTDAEHTRNDGYQFNEVRSNALNAAGQTIGTASRFDGAFDRGRSAWLYNGATTVNIGPTGIEHTRNDGYRSAGVYALGDNGHVVGVSQRFNGLADSRGQTIWLYNGSGTVDIGLTGAEHTSDTGYKSSSYFGRNTAGQVIGVAARYNGGGVTMGVSAWLYNGTTTVDVSLADAEHTRNDGYRFSQVTSLTESGIAGGYAQRFNGTGAALGQSAWVHNGTATVSVGLAEAEHTRFDGYRYSSLRAVNETGHAVGNAFRYSGTGSDLGTSAWLYDGTGTINIGLTDTAHTRDDGYQANQVTHLNAAGQAAGTAKRYVAGTTLAMGNSAWFYDPTLGETFSLDLSIRSDGFAHSSIAYLGDDGLVLGSFSLFDENDVSLGSRAFSFTLADGAQDLGSLVFGGLDEAGWSSLANTFRANGAGQLLGNGLLADGTTNSIAYILTPVSAVPVPGAVWLLGSGLAGLLGVARRRKAA